MFFIQALCSLMIMFVIQWMYALVNIAAALILFLYIGTASPGLPTGNCTKDKLIKTDMSMSLNFLLCWPQC